MLCLLPRGSDAAGRGGGEGDEGEGEGQMEKGLEPERGRVRGRVGRGPEIER